jgi:hypothetical protein
VREARPTVADLRTLIRRAGPDNDLVEATRKLPALQRVASPTFDRSREALRKTQPVLEFARPYAPDLVGGCATSARAPPPTTPTATTRASSPSSTRSRSRTTRRAAR